MKAILAGLVLACVLFGCGGDGILIISFTAGTIADDPACRGNGGQFNLRDQGGLTVLVVINSNTLIFVGNTPGTCRDLARNDPVNVRGPRQGNQITAQSVQVP
ncbi:MAG TPA: hypothetical protein VMW56_01975 [Candidatus Margulisiibacteriota bacterium]|nr:hypothetical protein [Candidatus Margulisiibacteriota bacterium]